MFAVLPRNCSAGICATGCNCGFQASLRILAHLIRLQAVKAAQDLGSTLQQLCTLGRIILFRDLPQSVIEIQFL